MYNRCLWQLCSLLSQLLSVELLQRQGPTMCPGDCAVGPPAGQLVSCKVMTDMGADPLS